MVNKNLFTVAFGSKRYKNMALALKKVFYFIIQILNLKFLMRKILHQVRNF